MVRKLKLELPGESCRKQLLEYAREVLHMEGIQGTVKDVELVVVMER